MQGPMHRRRMLDNSEYLNITRRHIECFPIFKYLEYCKADAYENSKRSSSSNSTPPRSLSRASIRSARLRRRGAEEEIAPCGREAVAYPLFRAITALHDFEDNNPILCFKSGQFQHFMFRCTAHTHWRTWGPFGTTLLCALVMFCHFVVPCVSVSIFYFYHRLQTLSHLVPTWST